MMATSRRIPGRCGSRSESGFYTFVFLCVSLWSVAFSVFAEELQAPTLQLAVELAEQGDHHGAAIEFRRLALESSDARKQGAYYWASAYEYGKTKLRCRGQDAEPGEEAATELRSEALPANRKRTVHAQLGNGRLLLAKPAGRFDDERLESAGGQKVGRRPAPAE